MKQLINTLSVIATVAMLSAQMAYAGIDKKLYERAAQYVWDTPIESFTPDANLTDSIFQNQSAVIIAKYVGINADYDSSPDNSKASTIGFADSNAIRAVVVFRTMIKLNDASALENFTEFNIDAPEQEKYQGYTLAKISPAFGAKIYKPDGTVKTVNMDDAVTLTEGKKNKDSGYKIAIPGLEAGDVLEYFYYTEYYLDELSLPPVDVKLLSQYPTRDFLISIKSAPQIAVEYGAYNGAPTLPNYQMIDGKCVTQLELQNMESLNEKAPVMAPNRQIPSYTFYCLNNLGRLQYVPKTARKGGIRKTNAGFINADIESTLEKSRDPKELMKEAKRVYGTWESAHPNADDRQRADALWLAVKYSSISTDSNELDRTVAFYKLLPQIGIKETPYIGYTTPRTLPRLGELGYYGLADTFVMLGNSTYINTNEFTSLPGEIPSGYDSEESMVFKLDPTTQYKEVPTPVVAAHMPRSFADLNPQTIDCEVEISPESPDTLLVKSSYTFGGASKQVANSVLTLKGVYEALGHYLGQKDPKYSTKFDFTADKERSDKALEGTARHMWKSPEARVTSTVVNEHGSSPAEPNVKYTLEGSIGDAVTEAGSDLIVNLGRFLGSQVQYTGEDRKRNITIVREYPHVVNYTITFTVPDGYEVVPESLKAFDAAIDTPTASLEGSASVEGNKLSIDITERYNTSIAKAETWESADLAIADAISKMSEASIVLRKK